MFHMAENKTVVTTQGIIRIPRSFYDDHADRGLDTPEPVKASARFVWIRGNDPALPELINDAEFYADPSGPDEADHVVRWAKSLIAALVKA